LRSVCGDRRRRHHRSGRLARLFGLNLWLSCPSFFSNLFMHAIGAVAKSAIYFSAQKLDR
jgi:hypothetical protein